MRREDLVKKLEREGVYRFLIAPVYKKDSLEHRSLRMRLWTTNKGVIDIQSIALTLCLMNNEQLSQCLAAS